MLVFKLDARDLSLQRKIGYTEKVMEHFTKPRNVGRLDDADVTAKVGSVACGDLIKLYLKVDDSSRRIDKITFESYGCAANIATSSIMTEMAKGKTIDEAKKMTFNDISTALGGLPKIKLHCAVLSKTALDAAIKKWEAKKNLTPIDETLVKLILRGVLDPVSGVDVLSGRMVKDIKIDGKSVTLDMDIEEGSETAREIEGDIREAFEGLDVDLKIIFKETDASK